MANLWQSVCLLFTLLAHVRCFYAISLTVSWLSVYNHTGDHSFEMDNYENVNVANDQPKQAELLHAQLRNFFTHHTKSRQMLDNSDYLGKVDMSDPFDLD